MFGQTVRPKKKEQGLALLIEFRVLTIRAVPIIRLADQT